MTDEVDGMVIDACVIRQFREELALDSGDLYDLVTSISIIFGIVLDHGGKIAHEWEAGSNDSLVSDWRTDETKNGRIKEVHGAIDSSARGKIHNDFGLPKGWDMEYIKCANVTELKYILTWDIHFFDPKQKDANHARKQKIKTHRIGRLCKYLKGQLGITVGLPDHCEEDLDFCATEHVVQAKSTAPDQP